MNDGTDGSDLNADIDSSDLSGVEFMGLGSQTDASELNESAEGPGMKVMEEPEPASGVRSWSQTLVTWAHVATIVACFIGIVGLSIAWLTYMQVVGVQREVGNLRKEVRVASDWVYEIELDGEEVSGLTYSFTGISSDVARTAVEVKSPRALVDILGLEKLVLIPFVKPLKTQDEGWWPQPQIVPSRDGKFTGRVQLGEKGEGEGESFEVQVFAVPEEAAKSMVEGIPIEKEDGPPPHRMVSYNSLIVSRTGN